MKRPLFVLLAAFWLLVLQPICPVVVVRAQEAAPQTPPAAPKQPTEAEARAQFAAADARRAAALEGSEERANAAAKAAQLASFIAWQLIYTDKQEEASTWFARNASLDQEAYKNSKIYLMAQYRSHEKSIKGFQVKLAAATTDEQRLAQRRLIHVFRETQVALCLKTLYLFALNRNDLDALLQYAQQAVAVRRLQVAELLPMPDAIIEPNSTRANLANGLEDVAYAQSRLKRFDEAEKTYSEALAIRQQLAKEGYAEAKVDVTLCAQGDLLGDRGKPGAQKKYEEARKELDASKPLLDKTLAGPLPPKYSILQLEHANKNWASDRSRMYWDYIGRYVDVMSDLGSAVDDRGDWKGALGFLIDGVKLIDEAVSKIDFNKASKTDDPDLHFGGLVWVRRWNLLDRIANIHAFSGDTERAMKEHILLLNQKRALINTFGTGPLNTFVRPKMMTTNLLMIAVLLRERDDINALEHARSYAEQTRQIAIDANELVEAVTADAILTSLSCELYRLYQEQHNDKQAADALRQAERHVADATRLLAIREPAAAEVALARRAQARVLLLQHQPEKALALLDGIDKLDTRMSLNAHCDVDDLRGQAHEMQAHEMQGKLDAARKDYSNAIESLEKQRTLSTSERGFVYLKGNARLYDRAIRLCIRLGLPNQAFDYLIQARSGKVQDLLRSAPMSKEKPAASGQAAHAGQQQTLQDLVARAKRQEDEISNLEARLVAEHDPQVKKRLEHARDAAQNRYEDLIKKMKEGDPTDRDHRDHLEKLHPTLKLLCDLNSMPKDMILVEYVPADNLYVFLLTRDGLRMRVLPNSDPGRVKQIADALRKTISDGEQKLSHTHQSLAVKDWMSQEKEVKEWRDELTTLYDLLLQPIELELKNRRIVGFIPDQYFHYIPMHALAYEQNHTLRFFIQDRQVFYLPANDLRVLAKSRDPLQLGKGMLACYSRDLPQAQAEVEAITALFAPATRLSGKSLTVSAITDPQNQARRYWHFALHTHLEQRTPRASFLQFDNGADDTGKWTLADIIDEYNEYSAKSRMKKVDLVTLPTCQSAIGEANPDGTEVMSLAGAFTAAGVDSVVATLWEVADDSTKDAMVDFYTQLAQGNSKVGALQHAQLKLMKDPRYNHPLYWAPFLLMGDWR